VSARASPSKNRRRCQAPAAGCPARGRPCAGHQPVGLGPPHRVERRRRPPHLGGAQPVGHRRQGEPPQRAGAPAGRHDRAFAARQPGELRHEPRLAGPGVAPHEHDPGPARGGGPPPVTEPGQLRAPADEPGRRRPRRLGIRAGEQPVQGRAGRLGRDDAELAFEDRRAAVVGADRARPVAGVGLQGHQGPVAGFLQRAEQDPLPGRGQCRGRLARRRPAGEVAQLDALPFQLGPGLEDPVVGEAGQQLAAVARERRVRVGEHGAGVRGGQRRAAGDGEVPHVDPARRGVLPAQVLPGDGHRRRIAQHLAQLVQFAAEVGQGLRVGGVRPEQPGDPPTGLRQTRVHDQVGHERDRPRRSRQRGAGRVVGDHLLSQKRNPQHPGCLPAVTLAPAAGCEGIFFPAGACAGAAGCAGSTS
jgi:hypothetical protein